jgi:hypothetical protein
MLYGQAWAGEVILRVAMTIETANTPPKPGDPFTYTIVVRNDDAAEGLYVHIWNTHPEYVVSEEVEVPSTLPR